MVLQSSEDFLIIEILHSIYHQSITYQSIYHEVNASKMNFLRIKEKNSEMTETGFSLILDVSRCLGIKIIKQGEIKRT